MRISVIIPAYNRAGLIAETLECMLRQTRAADEIIVVDDGSSDGTSAVVRQFGGRVRLIEQANAGPGAARNTALAQATGDFIQFFDSDDLCTLDKIELQARALAESGADIAYSAWAQSWFEEGRVRIGHLALQQRAVPVTECSAFLRRWVLFLPGCLIRRTMLEQVGGYPTAAYTGEDMELLFRLILADAKFTYVPGPLLLVRQHPENQISAAVDLAPMRARDRIHLFGQVREMLAHAHVAPGWRDRLLCSADAWDAARELAALDSQAPRAAANPLFAAIQRGRQIAASLRVRTGGSPLSPLFAPGPLTSAQRDGIRALGYEPY